MIASLSIFVITAIELAAGSGANRPSYAYRLSQYRLPQRPNIQT